MNCLNNYLSSIPLLIWQYDFNTSSFSIVDHTDGSPDPEDLHNILSNLVLASKKIVQDDFSRYKIFINSIKNGYPSSIIIRYFNNISELKWLKITSSISEDSENMTGSIIDITSEAAFFDKFSKTQSRNNSSSLNTEIIDKNRQNDPAIEKIRKTTNIPEMLQLIMKSPKPSLPSITNIVHIKVYEKKDKLQLITKEGEEHNFPYKDSFAEKIFNEGLELFIQSDCYKSTCTIDWAYFIPENILSYYALPLYYRKKLSEILVFCSDMKSHFSPNDSTHFDIYKTLK